MALDFYLFTIFNQYAGSNPYLDKAFIFFAEYLVIVFIFFFIVEFKNAKAVFNAAISSVLVGLINIWISMLYFRPRPFVTHKVHLILNHIADASFPSNHASISFAMATAVFLYNRKAGVAAYGIALLVALGRVFTGVHYVSDVFAGAVLGILVSVTVNFFIKNYFDKVVGWFGF